MAREADGVDMKLWLGKRNEHELTVRFPYNEEAIAKIRGLEKRWWIPIERDWGVTYSLANHSKLMDLFREDEFEIEPVLLIE
jgi:hypothetical protein